MIPLLGIAVFLFLAWCLSERRGQIPWRPVGTGLVLLFATAWFFLGTPVGRRIQEAGGAGITVLVDCSSVGAEAIFSPKLIYAGEYLCPGLSFLPSIIFIGSLTAVLYYLGILQLLIRAFAAVVTRVMGVSGAESLIATANIFLGMVEAPFAVRPYLPKFTRSELFCMMTSGMATIAGGVMVVYAGLIQSVGGSPGHLIIASVLSVFSAIVIAKIMVPETESERLLERDVQESEKATDVNLMDAACRGAGEGTKLAVTVMGMLIAFAALIAFVNVLLGTCGEVWGEPLTMQRVFSWFFSPLAWLMGIPWGECGFAGRLLGEKTVLNEFVAYLDMTNPANLGALSERSRVIMAYALCGFANFGSLAIMVGGLGEVVPERRGEIASMGIRSLVSGTLAAFITACLAALFL